MPHETKVIPLKNSKAINPNREPLTVEKLRTYKGYEHLNDHDAEETVFAIQTLATILYEVMNQAKQTIDEPLKNAA
jgi:hypothetical protein